ncbi:hypothetical protein Sjap_021112 [Stephania japonica]|uniref:Uncharacterized protein n=1 Tax=Stephania japonica TaxID=461633 RepID=A0AAP0HW62_9MAGN
MGTPRGVHVSDPRSGLGPGELHNNRKPFSSTSVPFVVERNITPKQNKAHRNLRCLMNPNMSSPHQTLSAEIS